jgi:prepilin-type N-terminal cleavage/methylation domain-containing protein
MSKAFSFTELLVAVSILCVVLAGMMEMFAAFSLLGEISGQSQIALAQAEGKMEEIKSTNFLSIVPNYSSGGVPGNTFTLQSLNGTGGVSIDNSVPDLLKVTVSVSFSVRNNRAVSPIILTTYVANR